MRIGRYLKRTIRRVYYETKNAYAIFFLCVAVINVLVPLIVYFSWRKNGTSSTLYHDILQYTQLFLPLFSVMCVPFVLREFVEADGNELLYVCRSRLNLMDAGLITLVFAADTSAVYAGLNRLQPGLWDDWLRLMCVCILYFGMAYFLVFLTRGVTVTLLVLIGYTIANLLIRTETARYPLYYVWNPDKTPSMQDLYVPVVLTGLVLLAAGVLLNRKRLRFN